MQRTILITGCSTGIGRSCAQTMRDRGWRVFATARKPADLASLATEGLEALYLDYREEASIAATADSVLAATGGRLDALFNNGAYAQPGALEDVPTAILREQFEANFFGWHDLTRRLIPTMRRQRHGRIVMCSSVLGLVTLGHRGPYSATKFALEAYSDSLRVELEGSGVRVIAIEPGPIRTAFTANALAKARENIDVVNSVHAAFYRKRLAEMERGGNTTGELGPEAVAAALVKACEAENPRPQYFVTTPTYMMSLARRILPKRALHRFVAMATLRG